MRQSIPPPPLARLPVPYHPYLQASVASSFAAHGRDAPLPRHLDRTLGWVRVIGPETTARARWQQILGPNAPPAASPLPAAPPLPAPTRPSASPESGNPRGANTPSWPGWAGRTRADRVPSTRPRRRRGPSLARAGGCFRLRACRLAGGACRAGGDAGWALGEMGVGGGSVCVGRGGYVGG